MANMDIGSKVSTRICKWLSSLDGQCSPWGETGKSRGEDNLKRGYTQRVWKQLES